MLAGSGDGHGDLGVLVVCGYFDWFSGYQEIGLVRALARMGTVTVIAGDRVNPMFSDDHIRTMGVPRMYAPGTYEEEGVTVVRVPTLEVQSMLWSSDRLQTIVTDGYSGAVVLMPGQLLPALIALRVLPDWRYVVLYGDNDAMYARVRPALRKIKRWVFNATKGLLYKCVNKRARRVYGYTPNTLEILRPFSVSPRLLPLAYDESVFRLTPESRGAYRGSLGLSDDDILILAPGKIAVQKKQESLALAVSRLRRSGIPAHLLLVGIDKSDYSKQLVEFLNATIPGAFSVRPFASALELNDAFNAADVGIWPAMPAITIQQAMGTGLSVIIPRNATTEHLLRGDGSGVYLPKDDDLATSIVKAFHTWSGRGVSARGSRAAGNAWLSSRALAEEIRSALNSE